MEIVKGAASALYRSDALGGVINLITREPSRPLETSVALSGSNFGSIGARVDAGFKRQKTYGIFSVERHQHDGFDLAPGTFDTTGAPYRRYNAMAKLRQQFTPSFSLGGLVTGYHNDTTGRSNGELGPQEDDMRETGDERQRRRAVARRRHARPSRRADTSPLTPKTPPDVSARRGRPRWSPARSTRITGRST